jgi:D-alanyl-D-alanine dipeptidase
MTSRTCISLVLATALAATASAAEPPRVSPATDAASAGLVEIRTLSPGIDMDIRYAGANNFTGARVPGYEAPSCYLLAPVAKALAQVEQDLRAQGFGLRLYDCYRPVRSVQAFMAWVNDPRELSRKAQQYPDLDKPRLLADGYIAERSGHSRGATVDLGLLDCRSGACTPLDMGTDFDFFGPRAHTHERAERCAAGEPPAAGAGDGAPWLRQLSAGVVALHPAARTGSRHRVRRPGAVGVSAGLRPAPAVVPAPATSDNSNSVRSVGWLGGAGVRGRRKSVHGGLAAASMRLTPRTPAPPSL